MLKKTLKSNTILHLHSLFESHAFSSISLSEFEHPNVHLPEDLFSFLADSPWAMWLDSCHSQHVDSRFDIMVWQPGVTLTTVDNLTTIKLFNSQTKLIEQLNSQLEPTKVYESEEDPLALINYVSATVFKQWLPTQDSTNQTTKSSPCINNKLRQLLDITSENKLPFLGGALGYFSYDLGRHFEKLPSHAMKDIHQPDMAVGIYSQALIYDRKTLRFYLICPESTQPALRQALINLLNTPKKINETFALTSPWQANMTKQTYADKFSQVQRYLLSGDCYQINLAQRFSANYHGDEFNAYLALRSENKAPFSAFIRIDDAVILSTSPERFIQLNNGTVQTKPIKGTRPRSNNSTKDKQNAQALLSATKDRAENLMIVDLLRNDLSKVCLPNTVKVPEIFAIESFPAVHHLVSTVEGELDPQYSATDLLRGAFPGGSITGAPKIRAMEIIDELEPQRRHLYCGSIGYISACGTMDTSITIRTLICENNNIYCSAGGGLVADSEVNSEYQETIDKVNKILPVLTKGC